MSSSPITSTTGELLSILDDLNKIFRLDNFQTDPEVKLGKELGKGKFGTVYQAIYNDQEVAVKVIDLEKTFYKYSRMIKAETFISKYLCVGSGVVSTPGSVSKSGPTLAIHKVMLCEKSKCHIIMELFNGYTLKELIDLRINDWWYSGYTRVDNTLNDKFIVNLEITISLIQGLQFLHSKGVYHQDIKPDNVMVGPTTRSGSVKFIDFGLSCVDVDVLTSSDEPDTSDEINEALRKIRLTKECDKLELNCANHLATRGTPLFMHPYSWVLQNKSSYYTTRNERRRTAIQRDWYALGIVIYMLWTGDDKFIINLQTEKDLDVFIRAYKCGLNNAEEINSYMRNKSWRPILTGINQSIPELEKIMETVDQLTTFDIGAAVDFDGVLDSLTNLLTKLK